MPMSRNKNEVINLYLLFWKKNYWCHLFTFSTVFPNIPLYLFLHFFFSSANSLSLSIFLSLSFTLFQTLEIKSERWRQWKPLLLNSNGRYHHLRRRRIRIRQKRFVFLKVGKNTKKSQTLYYFWKRHRRWQGRCVLLRVLRSSFLHPCSLEKHSAWAVCASKGEKKTNRLGLFYLVCRPEVAHTA